jgi:hypothetical protein
MYESGAELFLGRALMAALIAEYGSGLYPTDAAIIAKLVTLLEANLP